MEGVKKGLTQGKKRVKCGRGGFPRVEKLCVLEKRGLEKGTKRDF